MMATTGRFFLVGLATQATCGYGAIEGKASYVSAFEGMFVITEQGASGTDQVNVHFKKVDDTNIKFMIDAPTAGWAALAVYCDSCASMDGGDAVIGGADAGSDVNAHAMTAFSVNAALSPAPSWLSATSITRANGRIQVFFTRPFDNGVKAIAKTGNTKMIWAYKDSGSTALSYHGSKYRGEFEFNLEATTGPSPTPAPSPSGGASDLAVEPVGSTTYAFKYGTPVGITVHWTLNEADKTVDMGLQADGSWVGIGIPLTAGEMIGATAIVGSSGDPKKYKLDGKTSDQVKEGGTMTFVSGSTASESGMLTVRIKGLEIENQESVDFIVAKGSSSYPSAHKSSDREAFNLNLVTGSGSETKTKEPPNQDLVKLHAILQSVAWGVLAPCAVVIKRFRPFMGDRKVGKYPLAFLLHGALMSTAIIFCVTGVIIAIAAFDHRTTKAHAPLGMIVTILAFIQPWPAIFCRPDHESPKRKFFTIAHVGNGVLLILLAPVVCVLGMLNYKDLWDESVAPFGAIVYAGFGISLVVGIALQVKKSMAGSGKFQDA